MRIMLLAIDHNMHLSGGSQLNTMGEQRGHRKFPKRTQRFHAEVVREDKQYSYYPYMIVRVLKEGCMLYGTFSQPSDDKFFNPK